MYRKNQRKQVRGCFFCQSNRMPDYKESETLSRFISDRGKIVSRTRSGVCAKHQRRLARELKRARYLALIPYVAKV